MLAAMCTVVLILGVEYGLGLTQTRFTGSFYTSDPKLGHTVRPNAEGWWMDEFVTYARVNSDGLNDRERPLTPPPGTLRVAVIGSSQVICLQMPRERNWVSILNKDLSAAARPRGWNVDVVNLGGSGFSVAQIYMTMQDKAWKYHPQVVVSLVDTWAMMKATRKLFPEEVTGSPVYLLENGKLVPDDFTRNMPNARGLRQVWTDRASDLINRSYLLSLLRMAGRRSAEVITGTLKSPAPASVGLDPRARVSWDPEVPETQEAWAVCEAIWLEMKAECNRRGVEFVIVLADRGEVSQPDQAARLAFQRRLNLSSLEEMEHRIERFGTSHGISVISLIPYMASYAADNNVYLHGPEGKKAVVGHWNETGNAVAGHEVARELLERSLTIAQVAGRRVHPFTSPE